MNTLHRIQTRLKVPKGRVNRFANFNYRSLEDIMEAVKPHLIEQKATLVIQDAMQEIGGRVYIQASVFLKAEDGEWSTCAYAREPETKKGMDEPQITGTASSYARKYALAGLFLLDDTQDIDSMQADEPQDKSQDKSQDKMWLDEGGDGVKGTTKDTFIKVEEAVKSGRVKPADLRRHYKVSKQTMQYFESLVQ